MPERDPAAEPPEDPFEAQSPVERFVLVFVREPTLWPVLLVVLGHAAAFGAAILLMAVRERRPTALLALGILVVGTGVGAFEDVRRTGRPTAISGLLLVSWLLAGGCAMLAHRYGVF